jgi:hypothetical protein
MTFGLPSVLMFWFRWNRLSGSCFFDLCQTIIVSAVRQPTSFPSPAKFHETPSEAYGAEAENARAQAIPLIVSHLSIARER